MEINFELEIIGEIEDSMNDNVDVFVNFKNGEQYIGSFFTLKNIVELMSQHAISGESLKGLYFWSSDMIIIEEITMENIRRTINDQLNEGFFYTVFAATNVKAKIRKEQESPLMLNDD